MDTIKFEHQYTVDEYLTFIVNVVSGNFSGSSSFCISRNLLREAILALSDIYNKLKGRYQMLDYDSDDFMLFEFQNLGHISISGQVGGSHREQYLRYKINADQTVLAEIIAYFISLSKKHG